MKAKKTSERKLQREKAHRDRNRATGRCINERGRPHEPAWGRWTRCPACIEVYERSRKS